MTESEKREDLELDIWWEKRAKKILLICTAVCSGICLIGGIVLCILTNQDEILIGILAGLFIGIWLGPGLGGAISLFPVFIHTHKKAKERGEEDFAFIFNVILFFVFLFIGPVGLLIRVLRINHKIKKLEKLLSEAE